jgi:hypothetical protein
MQELTPSANTNSAFEDLDEDVQFIIDEKDTFGGSDDSDSDNEEVAAEEEEEGHAADPIYADASRSSFMSRALNKNSNSNDKKMENVNILKLRLAFQRKKFAQTKTNLRINLHQASSKADQLQNRLKLHEKWKKSKDQLLIKCLRREDIRNTKRNMTIKKLKNQIEQLKQESAQKDELLKITTVHNEDLLTLQHTNELHKMKQMLNEKNQVILALKKGKIQ